VRRSAELRRKHVTARSGIGDALQCWEDVRCVTGRSRYPLKFLKPRNPSVWSRSRRSRADQ
jgi:hypothetical protein